MIDRVKSVTTTQGQTPALPSWNTQTTKPIQTAPYNPIETFKTNVGTASRVATAGLGKISDVISAPQRFIQDKITGGKGYEDFYSNNPVGKGIVNVGKNKVAQAVLPPAAAFATPKRAALASELALDPLNLVGAGVVSKLGKVSGATRLATKILPKIEKIPAFQKVRDAVGAFQYGYGLESKFLKKYEAVKTGISEAGGYATKVATPLKYGPDGKELPKATQTILGDVMRLMSEGSNRALTPQEIELLKQHEPTVQSIFNNFKKLADAKIKAGGDPSEFSNLYGKYGGKRIFSKTFSAPKGTGTGLKLDLSSSIKRQNLSDETRKILGEVKEPAYGAALATFTQKKNLEIMKFFKSIAKDQAVSKQGFQALDEVSKAKYVPVPRDAKYGVLAGSYVPKQVMTYINPLIEKGATGLNKALESATKVWKPVKTVLSPGQLGRNTITSQIQAFLENPTALAYLPQAIKENVSKGKFYKALKNTGEIAQTSPSVELGKFIPEELTKLSNSPGAFLSKAWEMLKKPGSAIQNANETTAKLESFIARLYDESGKAGITIDEALKRKDLIELARQSAESSAFNYQKVSPLVSKLRKGAVPFITYPLKAAELTAKTAVKNPERLAAIQKGEQAVQSLTEKNKPDEQYLPSYLNQAVRAGNQDKKGATPYLNTKYLYPWGNMTDVVSGEGEFNPFTNLGISPSPFLTEAYSQAFRKDIFGKEIKEPVRHALETFGPSMVRSGFRLKDALTKNVRSSTAPSPKEILLKEVGVPLYKYNPKEGKSWNSWDKRTKIEELNKARRAYMQDYDGKKSKEEISKKMEWYNAEIRKISSE